MTTSPTPWKVGERWIAADNGSDSDEPEGAIPVALIVDADDEPVAEMELWNEPDSNAALIVEAVNNHERLKAENERLRTALENALDGFNAIEPHIPHVTEDVLVKSLSDIKAALGGEG